MLALSQYSKLLSEKIFERAQLSLFQGQRLLVTDFPDKVIELTADFLAELASGPASKMIDPSNVLYALNETECKSIQDRQKEHKAHQAGLSYCVNVRDSGKTAVFFVRRSLMPFVDESLGEKGSVVISYLDITPTRILNALLRLWLYEKGWYTNDAAEYQRILTNLTERCGELLQNERCEMVTFAMLDDFFSLAAESALSAAGYKAIGLVPADDPAATVADNITEIDRLRAALADPNKKTTYMNDHSDYDSDACEELKTFLDRKGWRVPLETSHAGEEYRKFLKEWPERCTLSFLQCTEKGSARIDLNPLKGGSSREFKRMGSITIIDEDEIVLSWSTVSDPFCGRPHQPLHSADNSDRGGNCTPVTFFGTKPNLQGSSLEEQAKENFRPNLHGVWDNDLAKKVSGKQTTSAFADKLSEDFASQIATWKLQPVSIDDWAWESHEQAVNTAYGKLQKPVPQETPQDVGHCSDNNHVSQRMKSLNEKVGPHYRNSVRPVIEEQFAKAGARLTMLLNQIWP